MITMLFIKPLENGSERENMIIMKDDIKINQPIMEMKSNIKWQERFELTNL